MNLTADQIIVDGDTAYVVAEGEPDPSVIRMQRDASLKAGMPWDAERERAVSIVASKVPPAWMTAKCETCDGDGYAFMPHDGKVPCWADCINGKPIHTVEVEHDPSTCLSCKGTDVESYGPGTISYRLVVREVLPIYEGTDDYLAICEVVPP